MATINLGDRVRDKVSGFTGIVVADTRYLNGCRRFVVDAETLHEGKPLEGQSFDQEDLELVQAGVHEPVPVYEFPDPAAAADLPAPVAAGRNTGGPQRGTISRR